MLPSCESDASSTAAVKSNLLKNRAFGSKIVKVMVHYTCRVSGRINIPKTRGASKMEASDSLPLDLVGFSAASDPFNRDMTE